MKYFVPYQQALELKELGFDEPCFTYYFCNGILSDTPRESGDDIKYQGDCKFDNHQNSYLEEDDDCSAPLFSQAFGWFREKHGIFVSIVPNRHGSLDSFIGWIYVPLNGSTKDINVGDYKIGFNTPEEAELACLIKLIEIVKTK
jgi:hypothetical protein